MQETSQGRLEDGNAARYDFSISDVLHEGWDKVSGFKLSFWGGFGIYLLISIVLLVIAKIIVYVSSQFVGTENGLNAITQVVSLIETVIKYPAIVGLMMMGVKRAANQPVQAFDVLNYYSRFWPLAGVFIMRVLILALFAVISGVCMGIAVGAEFMMVGRALIFLVGLVILAAGIYLFWGYTFSGQLCADKKLGVWRSLEVSRVTVNQHWFKLFFVGVLLSICAVIASIPLLIGLIWVLPWTFCVWGVLYKLMFGVDALPKL